MQANKAEYERLALTELEHALSAPDYDKESMYFIGRAQVYATLAVAAPEFVASHPGEGVRDGQFHTGITR